MSLRPHPRPAGGRPRSSQGVPPSGSKAAVLQSDSLHPFPGQSLASGPAPDLSSLDVVLLEFTARWERGESPRVEDYLDQLRPDQSAERIGLIYREFCLKGWAGLDPRPDEYLARFPAEAEALERLFRVDDALGSAGLRLWNEPPPETVGLPVVGDEIGPYRLIRELGQGAFARVFLAEQADLDDRLVVVKVSTRVTPEPSLLARASHPHIVEVLWNSVAEDGALQIICMPFLGGASLSAVLAERRRRGTRPGSGGDLLDDLDRASIDGYLPPCAGRPARELIAGLSYARAVVWVVARLAEALDFAYARGVLHGDIKPSNILLTADATPMLLDFNLAVGWRPHEGARQRPGDTGGTLAYMAPERLRTVADPAHPLQPTTADRHRADIFSLGVVLLEVFTGRAPEIPERGRLSQQELARFYVSSREHGGEVMIRSAHAPVPAALRSILARCLAPVPADRYARASELAEDLDRWRTDLSLAFAREPGRAHALLRKARRQRRTLAVLAISLTVGAVVTAVAWRWTEVDARARAARGYSQIVGGEDAGAFQFRRPGAGLVKVRDNPAEVARRHLERFGVLGSADDWRDRDEFRKLPEPEREDLEVWLLEQSLRFAHALRVRPRAASDWQRALICLERVTASSPCDPLLAECRALRRQLNQREPRAGFDARSPAPPPRWMVEYLLGVEAELQDHDRDARDHYQTALAIRPDSFWANYRAAVVLPEEGNYAEAVKRLRFCVERRPDNPALRRQFAGCLYMDHRYQEAIDQCDRAQVLDPDDPETYLTRSFLRIGLRQFDGFLKDIDRYDALKGFRARRLSPIPGLDLTGSSEAFGETPADNPSSHYAVVPFDPDEIEARRKLADNLFDAGKYEIALGQYDLLLQSNPNDLTARYNIAAQKYNLDRENADREFALVAEHPRVETLVREIPQTIFAFKKAASFLTRQGRLPEALQAARTGVRLSDRYEVKQAESYYVLARVYALLAKTDSAFERDAVDSLLRAYYHSERSIRVWYLAEPAFGGLRAQYGMSLFQAR